LTCAETADYPAKVSVNCMIVRSGWARKARRWLSEGLDVHVYFDNDAEGAAPHDALALIERLQ
jgi:hypothetical protein